MPLIAEAVRGEWREFSIEQIARCGGLLAEFHNLTQSMKLRQFITGGPEEILSLLGLWLSKPLDPQATAILSGIRRIAGRLICNVGTPTGFFSEFNPGHIWFTPAGVQIIDWEVGVHYPLYDLGGAMVMCFDADGTQLNEEKLYTLIQAYHDVRRLTDEERTRLTDALLFGVVKYAIWGMCSAFPGQMASPVKWSQDDIARLETIFRKIGLR